MHAFAFGVEQHRGGYLALAAALDQIYFKTGAGFSQFQGQVGVKNVFLQGEAKAATADACDHLAVVINGLAGVDLGEFISVQHQGAQLTRQPGLFLLDQRFLPDEIAFVEIHAEAQPGLIRCFQLGDIGGIVAIAFSRRNESSTLYPPTSNPNS